MNKKLSPMLMETLKEDLEEDLRSSKKSMNKLFLNDLNKVNELYSYLIKEERENKKEFKKNSERKRSYKAIVCINNGMIFSSMRKGEKYYNLKGGIGNVIHGERKFTTWKEGNKKLKWMYLEDYLNLTLEERNRLLYE